MWFLSERSATHATHFYSDKEQQQQEEEEEEEKEEEVVKERNYIYYNTNLLNLDSLDLLVLDF